MGRQDAAPPAVSGRDAFIDFIRAFSLLVVVAWHWVFTIIIWRDDGPHASNPIGFTSGLFIATWLLQVMPLFFLVGGFAHQQAWEARQRRGAKGGVWGFAWHRAVGLARPALVLAAGWWLAGNVYVAVAGGGGKAVGRAVTLVISPLWFLAVYLVLILLFPVAHWLHRRYGALVLVWGVGISVLVDVARFSHDVPHVAWVNMVVVWATCHQLGFFWDRLVGAGRRVAWGMTWGGLFALAALVGSRLYPGSMVGVPGERVSNMAPPTICILALVVFQGGVALLLRPWVLEQLATSARWARVNDVINRFSLPLYLFHSTGMAVWAAFSHFVLDTRAVREPDLRWWATRPTSFLGPLVVTLPIIFVLGRRYVKPEKPAPQPSSLASTS
jgi:hypothetical protein